MASRPYPTETPLPGWAEQNPELVWGAFVEAVREVTASASASASTSASAPAPGHAPASTSSPNGRRGRPGKTVPAAMVLDSALHSVVGLDRSGKPVTPILTWADLRATDQCARMLRVMRAEDFYRLTGCPVHPLYLPAKIAWFRDHQPEVWERVRTWSSVKGFVVRRLTGAAVEDLSVASGSGLLDIEKLRWCSEVLDATGIPPATLPDLVEPAQCPGRLVPEAAAALGLRADLPVFIGPADGPAANVGSGSVGSGQMAATMGTSGALRVLTPDPTRDPLCRTWCYYLWKRTWVAGAAVNNGGNVADWLRRNLAEPFAGRDLRAEDVLGLAAASPPGAEGLLCLPFLAGERSPGWNPSAKGVLYGLTLRHDARHVCRAALEGVIYQFRACFDALAEVTGDPQEIRFSGGVLRSPLWARLLADGLGRDIAVTAQPEASVVGSAALALIALGALSDLVQVRERVPVRQVVRPDADASRAMAAAYRSYSEAYRRLAGTQ